MVSCSHKSANIIQFFKGGTIPELVRRECVSVSSVSDLFLWKCGIIDVVFAAIRFGTSENCSSAVLPIKRNCRPSRTTPKNAESAASGKSLSCPLKSYLSS